MFREEYTNILEDSIKTIKLYWGVKSLADIGRAVKVELNAKGVYPTDIQLINFVVDQVSKIQKEPPILALQVNDEEPEEDEFDQEMADLAQAEQWADREASKYLAEYPPNAEVRECSKCGRVMRYNSMAYHEGFHFDSCL
jgi:hypothetical protein